jgi:hypothetical protein
LATPCIPHAGERSRHFSLQSFNKRWDIALAGARELVLDWWERAWTGVNRPLRPRFLDEARASLPLPTTAEALGLEEVFEGVQVRRALIRQDQRLPEW